MKDNNSSKKKMTIIYSLIIFFSVVIIALLSITLIKVTQENEKLKAEQEEIVEKYNKIANENENLNDPDYQDLYISSK